MASISIVVPSVGESVTEGILARWLKPDGAAVKKGEPIFELETDKASQEVRAEADGVLRVSAAEGDTVAVGASVGRIDTDATPTAAAAPASSSGASTTSAASPAASPNGGATADTSGLSPAVRRLATEEKIDLAQVQPTGPGGRITKSDVVEFIEARNTPAPAVKPAAPAPATPTPTVAAPTPNAARERGETRERMTGIRQKIAARLVEAQHTAAILTTFNEVDMFRVMDLRKRYKEAFQKKHGVGLGFMSFFVKAVVEALGAYPRVHARIEGAEVVQPTFTDIGVAVSTERGLMVPVLRDADRLSFAGIEKAIGDFAQKARTNSISVNDLQGGSFTITNGGVFGSLLSTPILNPPQSAILGMHKIQDRPVALNGQVVIRPIMYLALSYDHRLIDGREAVSFLVRVKECIEDPERLLLEV
jgi:2-oxoglutarate dehydrogenase E2 component (dihydrolipoamide succinyltransferase)